MEYRYMALALTFLLGGCANPYAPPGPVSQPQNILNVTYVTDPPGAVIYSGGNRMGYAPLLLQYTLTSDNLKQGVVVTKPITANWISGASTSVNNSNLQFKISNGLNWTSTINRPADVPGRDKDEQFALQVQAQKQQEQNTQNQILQNQQILQTEMLINQSMQNTYRPAPRINCTSTSYIPGQVNTNCY